MKPNPQEGTGIVQMNGCVLEDKLIKHKPQTWLNA
jgi:hypothetical protein